MIKLLSEQLTAQEHYKLLSGAIVPRPIAFVTTLSTVNGAVNAAPFSFFNVVSSDPPCAIISIGRKQGKMKDTARNALANKELVIHITDESIAGEMNKTAAPLDADVSELSLTGLHTVPSDAIAVPGIQEARVRFECRLIQHIPIINDAGETTNDLLLCRVLCYHLREDVYDPATGYVNNARLQPVARLAGNDYSKLGERFSILRP